MNRSTTIALACIAFSIASTARAQVNPPVIDNKIRILLVGDLQYTDPAKIEARKEFLQETWDNSSNTAGISIEFANNGNPIEFELPFPNSMLTGDANNQIKLLDEFANYKVDPSDPDSVSWRTYFSADVVIGFTNLVVGFCGYAPQPYWIGPSPQFIPDPDPVNVGMDLRGAKNVDGLIGYIALVSLDDLYYPCDEFDWTAAHEVGHLLGAGHYDNAPAGESWLYSDSRADVNVVTIPGIFGHDVVHVMMTGVGNSLSTVCNQATSGGCFRVTEYSSAAYYGDPNRNNLRAINKTAQSVANYVRGEPAVPVDMCTDGLDNDGDGFVDSADAECNSGASESPPPPSPPVNCDSTVVPTNVEGFLVQVCAAGYPGTPTQYRIQWSHGCPQEVSQFEVWYSQPDGAPYIFGWSTTSPFTDALVEGASARARIRSCGLAGCSALSSSSFLSIDQC